MLTAREINYSCLYGVTHDIQTGQPIVREPKLLKVSIGAPKGKAILVYTQRTDTQGQVKWWIKVGTSKDAKDHSFNTRQEAEFAYQNLFQSAPETKYPRKLPFFTFTRPTAEGQMEPDWDAIEAHGPMPTEIDVVFMSDQPFEAAYAMWSATELRCKGNGVDSERLVRFIGEDKTATPEEKQIAEIALSLKAQRTVLLDNCWAKGCRFSQPYVANGKEYPSPCKPSGDLKFQLANKLRVGGTAYFHTSGFRSIQQIFSALQIFRTLTGRGDPSQGRLAGLPFRMVIRPYKTKHNGQPATQYGISLEFRAETVAQLRQKLLEESLNFYTIAAPPRQISTSEVMAADTSDVIDEGMDEAFAADDADDIPVAQAAQAAVMAAEFYADQPEEEQQPDEPAPVVNKAASATQANTESLRSRLTAAKLPPAQPVAQAVAPQPAAAPVMASSEPSKQKPFF